MACLEDESRAREGHQCKEDPEVCSLEVVLHGYDHRIPAPTVRAMALSSMMARVKRARFAFTGSPSQEWDTARFELGGRAVSRAGRSLALRPRLATGLPWTISER